MKKDPLYFDLPNVNGHRISPDTYLNSRGLMVVFTCNHCPYSIAYEQRLIDLHNQFASKGIPLIAINPNDAGKYPQDSFENMVIRARKKGFPFPYLRDESQAVAKAYSAERTPHAFLMKRAGDFLFVVYKGAIDDNWEFPTRVKESYLSEAAQSLINGDEIETSFAQPVGCSVKWLP